MAPTEQIDWWRGYVNQLTYRLDPDQDVSDEAINWLADSLLEQRIFASPVGNYYDAANAALATSEPVAPAPRTNNLVRMALTRLIVALDERRPWPVPPYRKLDSNEWARLATAPIIGQIPQSRLSVGDQLHGIFDPVDSAGGHANILVVQLSTGEQVAFVAPESFNEPGVTVRAHGDPASIVKAARELTGLEIETA